MKNEDLSQAEKEQKIEDLVRALCKAEDELQELTGGEVDSVARPSGKPYLLAKAQDTLQSNESVQRKNTEILTAILDALPAQIALVDEEGVILKVNQYWRGFADANSLENPDYCIGQNYLDVCEHPTGGFSTEAKATAAGLRGVLEGKIPEFSLEYPCHSPGAKLWFRLMITPVAGGRARGAVVMHIEITERVLAEEKVKKREKRLHDLINGLGPSIFVGLLTADGTVLENNRSAYAAMGGSESDVIGKRFHEIPAWAHSAKVKKQIGEAVKKASLGEASRFDTQARSKQGQLIDLDFSIQPLRDESGQVTFLVPSATVITERRRALETVRATMEEFRILAEAMPQIVWMTRPDGWNLYFNQRWMDYTGLTLEESLGHGWNKPFHPDDQAMAWEAWQKATATVGVYSLEARLRRKDGVYRWWLVRGVPQLDSRGNVLKWFGTCTDIHDIKSADVEIARTNRALTMLTACNQKLIRTTREEHLLQEICQIIVETGGYKMAWVGYARDDDYRSVEPVAHAGLTNGYLRSINASWSPEEPRGLGPAGRAVRSGQATSCEDFTLDPSFAPWLEAAQKIGFRGSVCLPLRDNNRTFGVLTLYSAEIVRLEEKELQLLVELADNLSYGVLHLRSVEETLEQAALLNAASDAIILRSMDNRILFWNQGAERLYGWKAAEVTGDDPRQIYVRDIEEYDEGFRLLMESGAWAGELTMQSRDGRVIIVDARWTLLRDEEEAPKSVLAIYTDVTERKKLEAQLMRTQRMESIGTLAGGIAHDLNNALAPILMGSAVLKDEIESETGRQIASSIETSAQRCADMVRQVLSFARGVEGKRIQINLAHLLNEIRDMIRDTFPKNIEFTLHIARDLWTVTGDPTQLHQVFTNLCVNARDAMPGGGALKVTAKNITLDDIYSGMNPESKPGPHVLVQVEDTGGGIPPAIQEKIFEPFFTTKEVGKGTGLGLATTLSIIKSHRGFINLYSEMRKGTLFKVYIPADASTQAADRVAVEESALPHGKGELVLLIDDEATIRTIAQKTLERYGYRVLLAVNGAEAIALYVEHRKDISIVLTDMAMPVMDGPSTIIALKALNPNVKIVGSSGMASEGGVAKAIGAGIKHFVPKPYTAEAMLRILAEALRE